MNFILQAMDPIAFSLGPIDVRWYGLLIASGILIAYLVAQKEMMKRDFEEDYLTDLLIWAVPLSIVGARIYYVASEWSSYSSNPSEVIQIWNGGLAIHGALIVAFLVTYIFTKKRGTSFWKVTDIAVPSILIGQIIGRWGNFMNQEAHGGRVTREFLEGLQLPNWMIEQMNIEGTYYHPTFLYESLWNTTGLVLLLLLRKARLLRGEMTLLYIVWYSFGRFFIEAMRTDSLYLVGELRTAQVVSAIAFTAALILIVYRRTKKHTLPRYQDA